jgi:hypothetical protein
MTWGYIAVAAATAGSAYMSSEASKDAAKKQGKGADAAIAETRREYDQARTDLAPYRETGGQALNSLASGLGLQGYYANDKPLSYADWLQSQGLQPTAVAGGKDGSQSGLLGITGTGDAINTIKGLFGKGPKKPKGAPAPDTAALYQQYVKNYQAPEHAAPSTPLNDFNRDFTIDDFQKDPGYQFRMDEGTHALEASASARTGVQNGRTGKALERFGQDYASGEYSNAYNRFNADRTTRFNRLATLAGVGQTATNTGVAAGQNSSANISDLIVGRANADAAGRVGQANAVNEGVQTLGNLYLQRRFGGVPGSAPKTPSNYVGGVNAGWS